MKQFNITAEIRLYCDQFKLSKVFDIRSSFTEIKKIELKVNNAGIIEVNYVVETDIEEEAKAIVELHLTFLTDTLSFKFNLSIKEVRITSMTHTEKRDGNIEVSVLDVLITSDACIIEALVIGDKSVEELIHLVENGVDDKTKEYLAMYREAISEESLGLRFYLLYRLLERIKGGNRMNADRHIQQIFPQIERRVSGKYGEQEVVILTWIRDCIHPKEGQVKFPYEEITKNIHVLQGLVKKAVESELAED